MTDLLKNIESPADLRRLQDLEVALLGDEQRAVGPERNSKWVDERRARRDRRRRDGAGGCV